MTGRITSEIAEVPSGPSDAEGRPTLAREELLSAAEVAQWLRVSRAWVFEHANGRRRPRLPSVKLGKSVRFRPVEVDAFIRECERFRIRTRVAC
jgi:predicted DNA-binding transcriptional regulator AlpA